MKPLSPVPASGSSIDVATRGGDPIHVQVAAVPGKLTPDQLNALSDDERARAERMRNPQRRNQFVTARCQLKALLARWEGDWELVITPGGRPEARQEDRRLAVSIAHSGRWVAVGVGRVPGLGVDIEISPRDRDFRRLATRMGWPAGDRSEFLRRWALWEAAGKSRGLGALRSRDAMFDALMDRLPDRDATGPVQAGAHGAILLPVAEEGGWLGLVALETTLEGLRISAEIPGWQAG